jgi:hypothetical protein
MITMTQIKSTTSPVHRITISEDEISAVTETLEEIKSAVGITPSTETLLAKLKLLSFKIGLQIKAPAYVPTGKKGTTESVNLASLGATKEEVLSQNLDPITKQEAEFLAADHFISTGEKKSWTEFVDKVVVKTNTEAKPNSNTGTNTLSLALNDISNDNDLFAALNNS